jgi:hypothetical protein
VTTADRSLPRHLQSIVQPVSRLRADWTTRSQLSLPHIIQTGFGAIPALYPLDTGALPPEAKREWREDEHTVPTSTGVNNIAAISPLPLTSSW